MISFFRGWQKMLPFCGRPGDNALCFAAGVPVRHTTPLETGEAEGAELRTKTAERGASGRHLFTLVRGTLKRPGRDIKDLKNHGGIPRVDKAISGAPVVIAAAD
ncbi:hypothetical protein QO002_001081 [Pararhizobium capsulatum DSM 1112]|uniref:Uncharacterized protein n=1 Tax=Pararhizobium capsulatum DSM 1112 TaxID=1121113 RepID=A0ABU0BL20_9HYPH|nr:hypothetical protein [Pararhizobium capsulatum]MDQ0318943.1 hypothetical protein [Pararhizobium capsulatum DSM 1112]